jgi:hypothetical protein
MNQKLYVHLEVEKDANKFVFSMPVGAPLGDAYNACFEALEEILKMAKTATEKMKANESGEVVLNNPIN